MNQNATETKPGNNQTLDQAVGTAVVSEAVIRLTATPEPRVMVSLSRGSSSHEPLSQASYWGDYSSPGLGICAVGVGLVSGLHCAYFCVCHKTQNSFCPYAFSCAGPTSAYLWHYPEHWLPSASLRTSLGASLPPGHTAWPPAPITERAVGGLLRSVRPFSMTLA